MKDDIVAESLELVAHGGWPRSGQSNWVPHVWIFRHGRPRTLTGRPLFPEIGTVEIESFRNGAYRHGLPDPSTEIA